VLAIDARSIRIYFKIQVRRGEDDFVKTVLLVAAAIAIVLGAFCFYLQQSNFPNSITSVGYKSANVPLIERGEKFDGPTQTSSSIALASAFSAIRQRGIQLTDDVNISVRFEKEQHAWIVSFVFLPEMPEGEVLVVVEESGKTEIFFGM
jgi:hypothetical protein